MPIELIDSHAHLTSSAVYPMVEELLSNAQHAGITSIINICTDVDTLEKGILLAKKYPWIHNVASTTPHDVDAEGALEALADLGRQRLAGRGGQAQRDRLTPRQLRMREHAGVRDDQVVVAARTAKTV